MFRHDPIVPPFPRYGRDVTKFAVLRKANQEVGETGVADRPNFLVVGLVPDKLRDRLQAGVRLGRFHPEVKAKDLPRRFVGGRRASAESKRKKKQKGCRSGLGHDS